MLHLPLKLPSFSAVAAGQTANVTVPRGPTYRQFMLDYRKAGVAATEAQMATDLTRIRIKVNGVARIDISAAHLITILKYMGFTIDAGVLPIFLAWPTARTPNYEEALAWGTRDVDTLTVEVDIAAGAGAVTLEASAWINQTSLPLGPIMQMMTINSAASAGGVFELSTLPRSNGDLASIHFFSANITGLELLIDGNRIVDAPLATLNASMKWTGRVPQANVVHYEPTWLDRYDDRVPLAGASDVRFKLNMSAAGTVPMVMCTLAAPLGIPAR
ncbi:major capsid protein P2 [Arenibaculum sp.]|jgi:hypothetical protein|uniref:major capsid protein P2 n=1 Tax=Arenibaculum sp. TaxID=2865862 RepID=UPI002E0DFD1B|nr:major capsid protein P2 [Arenibaculum sp.]